MKPNKKEKLNIRSSKTKEVIKQIKLVHAKKEKVILYSQVGFYL